MPMFPCNNGTLNKYVPVFLCYELGGVGRGGSECYVCFIVRITNSFVFKAELQIPLSGGSGARGCACYVFFRVQITNCFVFKAELQIPLSGGIIRHSILK